MSDDHPGREFRTKGGHCTVGEGSIRLESSVNGYLEHLREGNRYLFWGVVASLVLVVLYSALTLVSGDASAFSLGLLAAALVLGVLYAAEYARGFRRDDEIPLDSVESVEAVEGTKGLTRPRLVVEYRHEGEIRKRRVLMPSEWLSFGEEEFRRAKRVFRDAGVPVKER